MKKLAIFTMSVLAIMILNGFSGTVSAGVEPSPFVPNDLKKYPQMLDVINFRYENVLNPHTDSVKGNVNGPSAKLGVIKDQISRIHRDVWVEIRDGPYDGGYELPQEYYDLLAEIVESAQDIRDTYWVLRMDLSADDPGLYKQLSIPLTQVYYTASNIVNVVDGFLSMPPPPPGGGGY